MEEGRFTYENDRAEAAAAAAAAGPEPEEESPPVSVADQRAQGVAPEDTVTMADQRAGAAASVTPEVPAQPQPKASKPPAPLG
jgi:hypothetical protein